VIYKELGLRGSVRRGGEMSKSPKKEMVLIGKKMPTERDEKVWGESVAFETQVQINREPG